MRSGSGLLRRGGVRALLNARPCVPLLAMLVALLAVAAPIAARADDELPGVVGRIADFAGQLYLSAQDSPADWGAIGINYPITSGDNLWVSGDGRAEVDYGGGQFRLAGDTNLNVSRLDDRQLTLFVARGRLIVRVRVLDTGDVVRIDTPNAQVALTRPGLYRVDITPDGQSTTVGVREGESLIALASGTQQALPGQTVTVVGMEPLAADIRSGTGIDGFDAWSANRDRRYERGRATAYVSRQMVGYAELDEYGSWEGNPTYGPVWYPTAVAADWAPYSDGYWTNVGAWGLTWVDSAPWGYAPSHYGRWVRVNSRWAWCPGAHVGRPHWAPALVGWYGGARWGITANGGAPVYGWVPLGWGDAYQPWWRGCSQNCWNRYNRPYAVSGTDRPTGAPGRYSHMGVPGAMTAVAGETLVGRKPVRANIVPVPASQTTSAPLLAAAPSIAPGTARIPVFRPGERGTPTPASALYSNARRDPGFAAPVARPSAPPAPIGATPTGTGAGFSHTTPTLAPRIRPAPAPAEAALPPAAGAPTPGGAAPISPSTASSPRGTQQQARTAPKSEALPPGGAPSAIAVNPQPPQRRPIPANAAVPPGSAPPAASFSGTIGTTGMALPVPSPLAPPVRALPAPSLGQPAVAVGAAPPAPVVAAPPERARPKPADDADAPKGGKAGDRNPGGGPAAR